MTASSQPAPPKTIGEILRSGAAYLEQNGVPNARLVFEQVLSHILNCKRLELYLRFERPLSQNQLDMLRSATRRLAAGEPLQYVVGDTEFMGRRFRVDRRVLIPRPETETLVEAVLKCGGLWQGARPVLADVGTGSGCIVACLALERPDAHYIAIDRSVDALGLARENAAALGTAERIGFVAGDLLGAVRGGSLDAVVSNPPYIRSDECDRLPRHIREHEPRLALDGGGDGLQTLAALVGQAREAVKPDGHLFMEIGCDQADSVSGLLASSGFSAIGVIRDLGGRDRVVQARR